MRFESKAELGRHLYDRAVEPWDTGSYRLRLAFMAAIAADILWEEHAGGGE